MNFKKSIATAIVIAAGVYAAASIESTTQINGFFNRIANDGKLFTFGLNSKRFNNIDEDGDSFEESQTYNLIDDAEVSLPPFPIDVEVPSTKSPEIKDLPVILPTTIQGGMVVTNNTSFELDLAKLVSEGTSVRLTSDSPQILIIHTHGSESYTPDTINSYTPTDTFRTEDKQFSVIRIGDELKSCFESYGLNVIHDRNIYDYPSYTGSYARSADAVSKYLKEYPSISIVLDIHRDAIGSGDVVYKTVAEADGKPCSQFMLLVGTGENGLEHPNWRENLKFALYLQSAIVNKYKTLARPIALKKERYNQQLSTGYLILEVGSSGNTLDEALNAIRLFADAAAPAIKDLIENQ